MHSIVVLAGGTSGEREVSLRSGKAVLAALKTAGYAVKLLDLGPDPAEHLAAMQQADVVFPVLHGTGGEDGTLQAWLEAHTIRFVGSDSTASKLCFDKWLYRQAVTAKGLLMAVGALVQIENYQTNPLAQLPYVLKPRSGGSSIDTFVVRDPGKPPERAIAVAFERHRTMLMEQLIVGIELTVGILDKTPLPVIEIIPPEDGEFDYKNKYNGATQELCPPRHVSEAIQRDAQELALQAHTLTGCRDFSRTDIIYGDGSKLHLLETNTIPGMTDQSLLPKMAATADIPMQELCNQLVEMAFTR